MRVRRGTEDASCHTVTDASGTLAAMHAFEIGLTPWRYDAAASADLITDQSRRAESLGFASFWLPESHFTSSSANPAPLLLLAAIAACTRSIRLATTSTD